MGKDNNRAPDFKVPIPYITEDEKEADTSDGKPPSVKLLLDATGKAIDNLTVQVQPIFHGGTTYIFFKWFQSLSSLLEQYVNISVWRYKPCKELTRRFGRGNSISQARSWRNLQGF
jgi:hypothetical protein